MISGRVRFPAVLLVLRLTGGSSSKLGPLELARLAAGYGQLFFSVVRQLFQ
jgi:hypothetical protein